MNDKSLITNIESFNNGTIITGILKIAPKVPKVSILEPVEYNNICLTLCNSNVDYPKLINELQNAPVNDFEYQVYEPLGRRLLRLTKTRENNNVGSVQQKKTQQWNFLDELVFKSEEGFKSYIVLTSYSTFDDIIDKSQRAKLIENDINEMKKNNSNIDEFLFIITTSVYDSLKLLNIEIPFKNFIIQEDNNIIKYVVQRLFGKIIKSVNCLYQGTITLKTDENIINNILHTEIINSNTTRFESRGGGIIEINSLFDEDQIKFVIFCEFSCNEIILDDINIYSISNRGKFDNNYNIVLNMLKDNVLFQQKKAKEFVNNEDNALIIHKYIFKKLETIILPLKNLNDNELNNIIKRVGSKVLLNIRKILKKLENDDFKEIDNTDIYMSPPILLPQVSCATRF